MMLWRMMKIYRKSIPIVDDEEIAEGEVFEVAEGIGLISATSLAELDGMDGKAVVVAELLHVVDFVKTVEGMLVVPDLEESSLLDQGATFEIGEEVFAHDALEDGRDL